MTEPPNDEKAVERVWTMEQENEYLRASAISAWDEVKRLRIELLARPPAPVEQRGLESAEKVRDTLAEFEATYYSHIQYPVCWIGIGNGDLKQEVNAARRKACFDHHKWGFQKGFDAGWKARGGE